MKFDYRWDDDRGYRPRNVFHSLWASICAATLSGTVMDEAGAVIPDVNIAVSSIAKSFERNATTNSEGIFVVPLLSAGSYTVKAEHEGFSPTELSNVILNVNDQRMVKITLNGRPEKRDGRHS